MTEEQLSTIEQRAAAATPAPWRVVHEDDEMCMNLYAVAHADMDVDTETYDLTNVICANLVQVPKTINHRQYEHPNWWNDAEFIAHAREDVPALCAEVHRLHAELDEYKQYEQIVIDNAYTKDAVMNAKRDEIKRLRASVERIGHERDQMIAANVELQERLSAFSAMEDDLK